MAGTTLRSVLVAGRYRVDVRLASLTVPTVAVDALADGARVVRLLRSAPRRELAPILAAWDGAAAGGLPVVPTRGLVDDAALGNVLVLGPPPARLLGPCPAAADLVSQARVLGAALVAAGVPVGALERADLGLDEAGSLVFHTPPGPSATGADQGLTPLDPAGQVDRLAAVVRAACELDSPTAVPEPRRLRGSRLSSIVTSWHRPWARTPRPDEAARPAQAVVPDVRDAATLETPRGGRGVRRSGPLGRVPPRRSIVGLQVCCLGLGALLLAAVLLDDPVTRAGSAAPRPSGRSSDVGPAAATLLGPAPEASDGAQARDLPLVPDELTAEGDAVAASGGPSAHGSAPAPALRSEAGAAAQARAARRLVARRAAAAAARRARQREEEARRRSQRAVRKRPPVTDSAPAGGRRVVPVPRPVRRPPLSSGATDGGLLAGTGLVG